MFFSFFPSFLCFFLLIANHTSNWRLSCQIQCINSLAQFMSCSLLSVFPSTWVFLIGTLIRTIFITELYVSCMWLTFFFPFTCLPIFFKEDEKKDDFFSKVFFLARYLIDFKVNYMKEILSGLAGFWKYFAVSCIC